MDIVPVVADKGTNPLVVDWAQICNTKDKLIWFKTDLFLQSVPQQNPICDSATTVASSVSNDSYTEKSLDYQNCW